MDGNRDLAGILSRMDALDRRIRAIEEYRRMAPDMSDQALWEMRRELDQLRAALGVPGTDCRQTGMAEPDRPRAEEPVPTGYSYVWPEPAVQNVQRTNWSERNLGKYLLGVLAAVLVLLAAGVLIAAVWPVIPDGLKFLALLACGIGLQLAGMRFALRDENRRNGFWLSVTGLGAGVSLMAVAAGCLAWGLYPLAAAGLLAAGWFGCNLLAARNLDSPVFYVIAYIGAALAVMLSVGLSAAGNGPDHASFRPADQLPVAVMPVLILALGQFAASRHPRRCLRALNWLAALFFIYLMGVYAAELAFYVNASAPGAVIAPAILMVFAHLIHISPDALERRQERPDPDWLRVLPVVLAGFTGMAAVYAGMNSVVTYLGWDVGGDPVMTVTGAAVSLAVLGVIAERRDRRDCLLLGLTAPLTVLFAAVSDSLFDLPCLLPALLCALLFTLDRGRGTVSARLASWLALGLAGLMVVTESGRRVEDLRYVLLYLAACFTYLAVLSLTYAGELGRGEPSQWRPAALLGCAVLIGLTAAGGAYTAARCLLPGAGPEAVYPEIIALTLLFHRWYVQAKTRNEPGAAGLARLLWSVCAGIFTLWLHMCAVFASGPEQGVCVMVLLAMAGSSVVWACTSGSSVYAILSVLFANETLAFAGGLNGIYGLALSVLGVCLCAGFIWLGFFRELRTMRRLGLAGMILYVVKIALLDVRSADGSVVSTALGLLFAGLVCFGVSFVYNRLDRKYGGGER